MQFWGGCCGGCGDDGHMPRFLVSSIGVVNWCRQLVSSIGVVNWCRQLVSSIGVVNWCRQLVSKFGAVITVVSFCILMVLVGFEESRIFGRML